jgi:hypothetical protein
MASASYLTHVRQAWDQRFPETLLAQQDIVITVPASFDESARALTLEAATIAGLNDVRLLEEPQAVCYDWLRRQDGNVESSLAGSRLLLVCDVGGGTTDLTLIKVDYTARQPVLTRIGVGDHLMLGGDNIDLTLAHLAESRLREPDKKLSSAELAQLLEQCRQAKEVLLSPDAPEQIAVTLLGSGASLIGGRRSTKLSQSEVRRLALDGFMPLSSLHDLPDKKRSGVVEFGLPYAAEPAISKHIAAFLQLHQQAAKQALAGESGVPDALLLNGGVFKSPVMVERISALLASWRGSAPLLLDNQHPELAVAYGAVSYALARRERKTKIGGGVARSYFLLIESSVDANQGAKGICILPKGSEEGQEVLLLNQQFALRLGQPVRFHLLSSSGDGEYKSGDIVDLDEDNFHSLPPLAVALANEEKAEVEVQLLATYTEMGVLHLQCVAVVDVKQRWDVKFHIRKNISVEANDALPLKLQQQLPLMLEAIRAVFGAKSKLVNPQAVKTLRADLEKILGIPRAEWPTPLLRALFTTLLEGGKFRRRSEAHERLWLNLTGFCLRPGLGYPLDDWRVSQLWKIYAEGLQFIHEKQNWTEWWVLWRRVAGGLPVAAQNAIYNDVAKYINPATARQSGVLKQLNVRAYDDMVLLVAVLERLPVADKIQLGTWLLKRLEKPGEPEQSWWAVGRIGARILFHANAHEVIPPDTVIVWIQQLLKADWKKYPQAALAATLLARCCNDRVRDINEEHRQVVLNKLKLAKAPVSWYEMVAEFKALDAQQERQLFGEALPPGIRLLSVD